MRALLHTVEMKCRSWKYKSQNS